MAQKTKNTHSRPDALDREISACFARADLRPAESPNTGYELDHHYRASSVSGEVEDFDLGITEPRPTVKTAQPE